MDALHLNNTIQYNTKQDNIISVTDWRSLESHFTPTWWIILVSYCCVTKFGLCYLKWCFLLLADVLCYFWIPSDSLICDIDVLRRCVLLQGPSTTSPERKVDQVENSVKCSGSVVLNQFVVCCEINVVDSNKLGWILREINPSSVCEHAVLHSNYLFKQDASRYSCQVDRS